MQTRVDPSSKLFKKLHSQKQKILLTFFEQRRRGWQHHLEDYPWPPGLGRSVRGGHALRPAQWIRRGFRRTLLRHLGLGSFFRKTSVRALRVFRILKKYDMKKKENCRILMWSHIINVPYSIALRFKEHKLSCTLFESNELISFE
jgi:hypothetical protein